MPRKMLVTQRLQSRDRRFDSPSRQRFGNNQQGLAGEPIAQTHPNSPLQGSPTGNNNVPEDGSRIRLPKRRDEQFIARRGVNGQEFENDNNEAPPRITFRETSRVL